MYREICDAELSTKGVVSELANKRACRLLRQAQVSYRVL